ncbi:hypothetical protein MMC18_007513 [Xylographa bjoerkii]|nr:hypothetical protein [Xylographa bjoerkii]
MGEAKGEPLKDQDWKKWADSAKLYIEGMKVVVKYLPTEGAMAEEIAEKLHEQNRHIVNLDFVRVSWIGKTEGREMAAVKGSVATPEMANFLLSQDLSMDFRRHPVEKFKKSIRKG